MLSAAPWSFAEMRAALEPKLAGITWVTVITHGWQATDWGGDSLAKLSTAIFNAAERAGSDRTWLIDYDVTANRSQGVFDREQSRVSATNPSELILQWDWAPESNEYQTGWTEAAGDALFSGLVGLGLVDPASGADNSRSFHFLAHSFGSAVTSEAI